MALSRNCLKFILLLSFAMLSMWPTHTDGRWLYNYENPFNPYYFTNYRPDDYDQRGNSYDRYWRDYTDGRYGYKDRYDEYNNRYNKYDRNDKDDRYGKDYGRYDNYDNDRYDKGRNGYDRYDKNYRNTYDRYDKNYRNTYDRYDKGRNGYDRYDKNYRDRNDRYNKDSGDRYNKGDNKYGKDSGKHGKGDSKQHETYKQKPLYGKCYNDYDCPMTQCCQLQNNTYMCVDLDGATGACVRRRSCRYQQECPSGQCCVPVMATNNAYPRNHHYGGYGHAYEKNSLVGECQPPGAMGDECRTLLLGATAENCPCMQPLTCNIPAGQNTGMCQA